jgi:ABC-type microcin C transport system duplicated ATPase subunit YejF
LIPNALGWGSRGRRFKSCRPDGKPKGPSAWEKSQVNGPFAGRRKVAGSDLARAAVGPVRPAAGRIVFHGRDVSAARRKEAAQLRRRIQLIPQDPYAPLNPRMPVGATIAEAVNPHRGTLARHRGTVETHLARVALPVLVEYSATRFDLGVRLIR